MNKGGTAIIKISISLAMHYFAWELSTDRPTINTIKNQYLLYIKKRKCCMQLKLYMTNVSIDGECIRIVFIFTFTIHWGIPLLLNRHHPYICLKVHTMLYIVWWNSPWNMYISSLWRSKSLVLSPFCFHQFCAKWMGTKPVFVFVEEVWY